MYENITHYLGIATTSPLCIIIFVLLLAVSASLLVCIFVSRRHYEKKVGILSQKYQTLFSNINGGMFVVIHSENPQESILTYISPVFTEMTGYTLEDIQKQYGGRYIDIIHEEDREQAFKKHLEELRASNTYRLSYRLRKKDGSIIWIMDNGYLVRDAEGLRNHSIITDITAIKQQEEALRLSENRFSIAVNASSGTMFEVDLKKQLYTHFENAERIFGISAKQLLEDTQSFSHLSHAEFINSVVSYFFHPDEGERVKKLMIEATKLGNVGFEVRLRRGGNDYIWVKIDLTINKDTVGIPARMIGFMVDIDNIKRNEEELRLSEKRYSVAINASSGTLFELDLTQQVYTHFENAERLFGISTEQLMEETRAFSHLPYNEFVDKMTKYFFHPDDYDVVANSMIKATREGSASYEGRIRKKDGSYIWTKIDLSMTVDKLGAPLRLIGYMSDINEIKNRAELLERRVQSDPMTGLYNKVATVALSNKILANSAGGLHALIVLDIDNFKGINDTLGHAFGDIVLIDVRRKLTALMRNNDIIGRMGGDEFAVFMVNVQDTACVLKKATELSKAFRQTYVGEKEDYKISCSMGIIMVEDNFEPFDVLYRKADSALYKAKQNGKDQFVLYQEKDADSYPLNDKRTNDEDLQNLKVFRNIDEHIFELMYTSKDFNVNINMALAAIGQQYHVSRVAIFENDDGNGTSSDIYEWCNDGVSSQIAKMQHVPLSRGDESVIDSFDQNGLLYCNDVRELSPYMREILEKQDIKSSLQTTIGNDEKTYGFIGFDECDDYRIWTSEEIEKLSYLSKVLSVFLFKEKAKATVLANLNNRLNILDILPDFICVVNPKTHCIEYANKKMRQLIPNVSQGAFCFSTLRGGQRSPCSTCLIERIKNGDTKDLEIVSEDNKIHLSVDAIAINWTNSNQMVLLYGSKRV